MMNLLVDLERSIVSLRQNKPLILCLTNYVTMDFMANCLLALGAVPLMTEALDEIDELVSISQAININLGTLDQAFGERASRAAHLAKAQSKAVILDPVGAGASKLRTKAAKALLPLVAIVRANASELLALANEEIESRGVEASHPVSQARSAAKKLALAQQKIVVVSGPVDFLTDGLQTQSLGFGSRLMPLVTGMGCTLTAVIAAFAAGDLNFYQASLLATTYFGLCGQLAYRRADKPGSFRQVFIDTLFQPDWSLFAEFIEQDKVSGRNVY